MTTQDDKMVNMFITRITVCDARRIAELIGNGAVLWENNMCYPTGDCECSIYYILEDGQK